MSETPPVRHERDGDCLILTFNRPDRLNALSSKMLAALKGELDLAADPDAGVRALILTGAGRGFSSGADLAENPAGGPIDLATTLRERYAPVIERLVSLPFPVVAAVNGAAAGAGMSLALACDFIIASRSAYFLQAFINIGLVPDAGSTWFLPRLVGPQRARRLMMLGERLEAERAWEWGLVHEVVADQELMTRARAFAGELAEGPTRALAGIRTLLRQSLDSDLPAQLEHEAVIQGLMGRTSDFLEGVSAFLQKRPARFRGK
ncbi:MAG: 2-(1,2-epoxy-1,2-dihydrophenyl)acetyl-CoA isomerase [Alphaproteobacteria bacterium]|nr:MAG: 2-(1,2-epoxy-1,2-dihydrophenyl)acetyl-CoA isomerase [Alphaproteobacteria bacterium]